MRAGNATPNMAAMDVLTQPMPEVTLPNGTELPALGLGTWRLGESAALAGAEVKSLRLALDMGYRVFDCAEMYGEGGAETVLGHALAQAQTQGLGREQIFAVSKFYPVHATVPGMVAACERSLRRLQLDHIDLYLLHWRGDVPLRETVQGFEVLQRRGWIRHWGVSNFDLADLHELDAVPGGSGCAANQVWYSLSQRGVEHDLLPWQRVRQVPLMAYSPIDQGELARHPALSELATSYDATPAQLALAWLLTHPGVMAIPKAADPQHLRENWRAAHMQLDAEDLRILDLEFAAPRRGLPLAMR